MSNEDVIDDLREQVRRLKEFKAYVHKRLDNFSVPSDPEPERNKETGCRIEGRLNWLFSYVNEITQEKS